MTDAADRDQNDKSVEPNFSGQGADAPNQTGSAEAASAREPSKEIVLQRLTPHSSWDDPALGEGEPFSGPEQTSSSAARRYLSMAAVVALAALVGAIGGSAATFGIAHYLSDDDASILAANQYRATQNAVAKLASDVAALKTGTAAHAAKTDDRIGRVEKLEDRVTKVEKAQAEPAAKLAKLSEAVDKLRAAEATGSISKPAASSPAPVVNRLPIVDGWTLLGVGHGSATVEGRRGVFEVFAGDPLPGVGRVDAIRRQDGRWVVVTSRGLIVAR